MLRESTLNTKRTDLGKCVASRKRKLAELYSVVATVNATVTSFTSSPDSNTYSKFTQTEFEDANDIHKGRVFDVATLLRIPGFAPQQAKGSIEALDGSKPQISQANSPKTKALQTVPSKVRDVSLASNETTDSTQSLHPDHGRRDHGNDAMEGVCNDLDANHSGQGDSIDARSRDSRQDIARGSVGMPGATGQSKIVQDDIVPAGAGSSIPLSLEHTDDDSTIRLVPKPRKTHVLPSTPDAQLRLEAAQSESQTAGVSAEPAPIAPVSDHVSKAANGMTIKPDAAPLVQAKPSEDHTIAARRQGHQQDQRAATDTLGDVSANQRPPMRIDTTISRPQPSDESSTPAAALTPLKSGLQSSPPERMTTRVSSGALRHKSVSEILGETPKSAVHAGDRTPHDTSRESDQFTSRRSSLLASPESATKSRFGDFKDKDRSKLSTVVFARQQPGDQIRQGQGAGSSAARRIKSEEEKDYLVPLFAAQAQDQKPSLEELIRNSNKTLSTSNWYVQYQELHDCRILKRIYHLQNSNRWSLRQIERSAEPPRPTSHWDMLLNEMKWLRTDFREERKWKQAAAKNLAEACAEWVQTPEALRPSLQVRIKKPHPVRHAIGGNTTPVSTPNAMDVTSDGTPELIASAEDDMSDAADDLPMIDLSKANAPAALFALAPEDVLFDLDRTPAADKLLSELPLYQPFTIGKGGKQSHSDALDAAWRKPVVPVSKFALANLVSNDDGPPRKRSRYEYQEEEEAEFDSAGRALLPLDRKHGSLSPEQENVALFDPKNKHIISRLHAAHSFRPPSEFPMPTKAFFESRNPSQWTVAEDDELRRLVREYEYNWPLISASLASQSMFSSGAERRTPWECFERWESFEGLPGDMDKHSYFKAWKVRRQDARMHLEELYARQQQAGATAQMRRRNAEPVHVERRRNNKHLALIHAMSKVAKKKESAVQKQAHAASMAAMRKATEPSQKKLIIRTPREFSDHKHEQEVQFKEKQMLYRQQMQANQRAMQAQRTSQQPGQQQNGLAVPQPGRMPIPAQVNGASPRIASSLPQGNVPPGGRPLPQSQGMHNGMAANMTTQSGQVRGNQQTQMHPYLQNQQRMPGQTSSDPARVLMEANRVQEQQRMMQQQRQFQGQPNGSNGAPTPHGNINQAAQSSPGLMGNIQPNGIASSPNHNQNSQRNSSSPGRIAAAHSKQLSTGFAPILAQIQTQIRTAYPNMTPEQVTQMATHQLNQHLMKQNSQVGSNLQANSNAAQAPAQQQNMNYNPQMNPQVYAQVMRSQQAHQQSRMGADANGTRPESRGTGTPRPNIPTNGSSQSPNPVHAQVASTS